MTTKEFTSTIWESFKWLIIASVVIALAYGLITVPSILMRQNANDLIFKADQKSKTYVESVRTEINRDYVDYISSNSSENQKAAIKLSACDRYNTIKDSIPSSPWANICK